MNKKRIIKNSIEKLVKAEKKLQKAKQERIWIENNPKINIFNYPFYKLIRFLKRVVIL